MRKFNQTVSITVEVDVIAEQFLATIKEDEKHRELIAEAVVGNLLNKDRLTGLYNALNGYNGDIDFKVGDFVHCKVRDAYDYKQDPDKPNYREFGNVEVVDIDKYRDLTLNIQYERVNKDGSISKEETWVHHTSCSKITKVKTAVEA